MFNLKNGDHLFEACVFQSFHEDSATKKMMITCDRMVFYCCQIKLESVTWNAKHWAAFLDECLESIEVALWFASASAFLLAFPRSEENLHIHRKAAPKIEPRSLCIEENFNRQVR